VSQLTGDEPDLKSGDSGEGVVLLQVRLYGLGLLKTVPDGTFNMTTENAVRELQSTLGHDNNGDVTKDTWEAILYLEQQYGINYQYTNPYDAVSQINYDLQHPEDGGPYSHFAGAQFGRDEYGHNRYEDAQHAAAQLQHYAGQLSEDGQWRWDGAEWQPAHSGDAGYAGHSDSYVGQLSADGQWRWDGTDWQPAHDSGHAQAADSYVGQLSADGHWRWDGREWQVA